MTHSKFCSLPFFLQQNICLLTIRVWKMNESVNKNVIKMSLKFMFHTWFSREHPTMHTHTHTSTVTLMMAYVIWFSVLPFKLKIVISWKDLWQLFVPLFFCFFVCFFYLSYTACWGWGKGDWKGIFSKKKVCLGTPKLQTKLVKIFFPYLKRKINFMIPLFYWGTIFELKENKTDFCSD